MPVFTLPTSTVDANYVFTVDLDGIEFQLDFKFNARDDAWFMTILDVDDNPLRAGLKVVNEWLLLRLWVALVRPEGELLGVNLGDVPAPPTLNQLGSDVVLTYLDAAEIASLA